MTLAVASHAAIAVTRTCYARSAPAARLAASVPHGAVAALSICSRGFLAGSRVATARGTAVSARRGAAVSASSSAEWVNLIKEKNAENAVVVYSKSWCPFCTQVKAIFKNMEVEAKVIELDNINEGDEVQGGLLDLTGQRTVPSVFIGGEHIGGCDDTVTALRSGALGEKLTAAGVSFTPL